jgi:hypothetical protein
VSTSNNTPQVVGTCNDLDAAAVERVTEFMAEVVRAFTLGDAVMLEALSHPGDDPRSRKNSREFDQSLMDGGDKVQSWSARPYTEPKWSIMRMLQHHPPPSVWIDVTLNDGKRDYPICFALAPDADGTLRSCYYIDREQPRKPKRK